MKLKTYDGIVFFPDTEKRGGKPKAEYTPEQEAERNNNLVKFCRLFFLIVLIVPAIIAIFILTFKQKHAIILLYSKE